jgi:class 3 adenylate cyclase
LREPPVEKERVQRRLAAILAADVAGYSRLTGVDEKRGPSPDFGRSGIS